jgi:hypothetical protein
MMNRQITAMRSPLITPAWEVAGIGLLPAVYWIADWLFDDSSNFMNITGPVWLTAVLWLGAVRMVRLEAAAVWTALFWFRVSSGVYFGAGALIPVLGSAETRLAMQDFYPFSDEEATKVNLIVAVGCAAVLISANIFQALLPMRKAARPTRQHAGRSAGREMLLLGLLFLAVGGTVRYVFVMPAAFGWLDYTVPGGVGTLANMSYGAIFLLTAWSWEHRRSAFPLVVAFVLLEMVTGVLMLTKQEPLMNLIVFLLGLFRRRLTLARLGMMAVAMSICYLTVLPLVQSAREQLWQRYGSYEGAGLAERLELLSSSVTGANTTADLGGVSPLMRFSYMNQAAFAVSRYDMGYPGNSFSNAWAVLIPRLLWPDKPIITDIGTQFNYAVTGNDKSATSPGLFCDAYWDFGWPGVVLLMIVLALILTLLSRFALDIVRRDAWVYFPVVLLGVDMGFSTAGYFVVSILGGGAIFVSLYILLKLFDSFVLSQLRQPPIRAF